MRLICLLLQATILILIISSASVSAKKNPTKFEKWHEKARSRCENSVCSHLPKEMNENCVNQCAVPSCFKQIYASNPLEDDEQDYKR